MQNELLKAAELVSEAEEGKQISLPFGSNMHVVLRELKSLGATDEQSLSIMSDLQRAYDGDVRRCLNHIRDVYSEGDF